jgi:starch synthase
MLEPLGFRPDILHCNDWQTGLVPVLRRAELARDPFLAGCGTLFSIHNLGYQGLFPPSALATLGLGPDLFTMNGLEYWGSLSLLKGGIVFADRVSTVSPTYCRETLGPELGLGFDGILRGRGSDYSGILNGLDPKQWNPATDHALPHRYDDGDLRGKAVCKRALQKELGLAPAPATPLVALVTRLDTQKGLELVEQAWAELLGRDLQLVLLGTGEERHTAFFAAVQNAHPGQVAIRLEFDDALSRRIYAGADLFLMPSRYEPCGLGQLIALRYGTVPVVRRTGGLADTITDPQDDAAAANGFSFEESAPEALLSALDRALALYRHRSKWRELVRRGMAQDFSWGRSAQRYLGLYHRIAEARHAHP